MTRIGAMPFNWISAFCGVKDDTDLRIWSSVLDFWPYNNEGRIQRDLSTSDRARRVVMRYLKQLEEAGVQNVTLDDIARILGLPVEVVERVCNDAELELYVDE